MSKTLFYLRLVYTSGPDADGPAHQRAFYLLQQKLKCQNIAILQCHKILQFELFFMPTFSDFKENYFLAGLKCLSSMKLTTVSAKIMISFFKIQPAKWQGLKQFLIARLARSDPRNHFVLKILSAVCSNFRVFQSRTSLGMFTYDFKIDMFKNCINSYHIESKQV